MGSIPVQCSLSIVFSDWLELTKLGVTRVAIVQCASEDTQEYMQSVILGWCILQLYETWSVKMALKLGINSGL